jgi:hypothetical protein
MSAVKYFNKWDDARARLEEVKGEWPAAKIVGDGIEKPFYITGDFACTKFLHEDGHVY